MLKSIAQPSPELQAFIQSLDLPLNQAQQRGGGEAVQD
jgi:hypothetical protein